MKKILLLLITMFMSMVSYADGPEPQEALAVEESDIANGRITINQKIALVGGVESATAAIMQGEDEPGSSKKSAIDITEELPYDDYIAAGETKWLYVTVPNGETKDITVTCDNAELSIEDYNGTVLKSGTGEIKCVATAKSGDEKFFIKVKNNESDDMDISINMEDHEVGPGETKATAIDVTETGDYTFDDETRNIWVKYVAPQDGFLKITSDVNYKSQNEICYYAGDDKLGYLNKDGRYEKIVIATSDTEYYVNAQLDATAPGRTIKFRYEVDVFPTVTLNSNGLATYSAYLDLSIMTSGVKAYKAAVDGETITLTELDGYIPAGTGIMLGGEAGTTVTFDAPTTGTTAADVTGNDLKATTNANGSLATVEANSWALKGNEFLQYTPDTYEANRAYLVHEPISDQANSLHIVFADAEQGSETSIETVSAGTQTLTFDLNGRRATAKGLQIKNSKAVFVK